MQENFRIKGRMVATLVNEKGDIKQTLSKNIILNSGFDFIANAIGNSIRPAAMNIVAVGEDGTLQKASDTSLGSAVAEVQGLFLHTAGTKTFEVSSEFGPGVGTGALKEAGVKNSAGDFIDRTTFDVINKGLGDTLKVTFTFDME